MNNEISSRQIAERTFFSIKTTPGSVSMKRNTYIRTWDVCYYAQYPCHAAAHCDVITHARTQPCHWFKVHLAHAHQSNQRTWSMTPIRYLFQSLLCQYFHSIDCNIAKMKRGMLLLLGNVHSRDVVVVLGEIRFLDFKVYEG